jgi:hypothetical protein
MKASLGQVRFGGPTVFLHNAMGSLFKSQSTYTSEHVKDRNQIMKLFARSKGLKPAHPTYKIHNYEREILKKFASTWQKLLGLSTEKRLKSWLSTLLTTPITLTKHMIFDKNCTTLNRTLSFPSLLTALTHKYYCKDHPDLHLHLTPKEKELIQKKKKSPAYLLTRPNQSIIVYLIHDPKNFIRELEHVEFEISEWYVNMHIDIMTKVKVGVVALSARTDFWVNNMVLDFDMVKAWDVRGEGANVPVGKRKYRERLEEMLDGFEDGKMIFEREEGGGGGCDSRIEGFEAKGEPVDEIMERTWFLCKAMNSFFKREPLDMKVVEDQRRARQAVVDIRQRHKAGLENSMAAVKSRCWVDTSKAWDHFDCV